MSDAKKVSRTTAGWVDERLPPAKRDATRFIKDHAAFKTAALALNFGLLPSFMLLDDMLKSTAY